MNATIKTISIEKLAEKINGKLWVKGDLKRIYLNEGYNTKKMSTKTYVFQKDNGEFGVSCNIECPSQAYEWIKSQENKIIDSLNERIQNIESQSNLVLVEYKINGSQAEVLVKKDSQSEPVWFTEEEFNEEFGDYPADVFGGDLQSDLEKVYEIARNERIALSEKKKLEEESAKAEKFESFKKSDDYIAIGQKVSHQRFGLGEVIDINEDIAEIKFENNEHGTKKLLVKYANLELCK